MKRYILAAMMAALSLSTMACSEELWEDILYGYCDADDDQCIQKCYVKKCGTALAYSMEKDGAECRSEYWNVCVLSDNDGCYPGELRCLDACYQEHCGLKANNPAWDVCVEINEDLCTKSQEEIDRENSMSGGGGSLGDIFDD